MRFGGFLFVIGINNKNKLKNTCKTIYFNIHLCITFKLKLWHEKNYRSNKKKYSLLFMLSKKKLIP